MVCYSTKVTYSKTVRCYTIWTESTVSTAGTTTINLCDTSDATTSTDGAIKLADIYYNTKEENSGCVEHTVCIEQNSPPVEIPKKLPLPKPPPIWDLLPLESPEPKSRPKISLRDNRRTLWSYRPRHGLQKG